MCCNTRRACRANGMSSSKINSPLHLNWPVAKGNIPVASRRCILTGTLSVLISRGNRIYAGASYALKNKLANAAFLRTHIDKIETYFSPGEVASIWITFPDPQLRVSRAKKRLTHPRFLRLYQQILAPGGVVHLKTDSPVLYRFTLHVIERYGLALDAFSEDVYAIPDHAPELDIKTHYEKLDIAGTNKIFYCAFRILPGPLPALDDELLIYLKETENRVFAD